MELRDAECRECRRSTGGDCGEHGPIFKGKIVGSRERPPLEFAEQQGPDEITRQEVLDGETPLFHFACSLNPDHVIYVKIGYGMPPQPTICPWKCAWMNLIDEVAARGL
jgi:hypothetical protein